MHDGRLNPGEFALGQGGRCCIGLGQGKIDFAKFKETLKAINYTGWLVLELDANMVRPLSHEAGYKANAECLIYYLRESSIGAKISSTAAL